MPISFPHLGTFTYVMQSIAQEMNRTDMVVPNKPTNRTKQIGARYSPEFICTPFKMLLGSTIEVLERGAYEILGTLFVDYCRLGYYTPVMELILEDLGFDFEFMYLNYDQPVPFIMEMKRRSRGVSYLGTARAFQVGWVKNRYLDIVERYLNTYRAIELSKGTTEAIAENCYKKIVEARKMRNIRKLPKMIHESFKEVELDKKANPLKVGIVGELYAVIEPAINLDIMRRLNHLGVVVYNPISFTRWLDIGRRCNIFKKLDFKTAIEKAKPYVGYRMGGKTQESIGYTIMCKEKGFDGMVHLYPFTCMPEIIVRSIIPQLSKDYNIPILSLVLDEHTGEAGLQTRLEAFVDLLEQKRKANGG
ncbi:MAG: CoA protein activase [Candidatus Heimdallarchaeota archaeon]